MGDQPRLERPRAILEEADDLEEASDQEEDGLQLPLSDDEE